MQKILKSRQIDTLFHFTRIENLNSILTHGLYPRRNLEKSRLEYIFNDEVRLDGCENAICASIEFPNYKMFYTLRQDNPGTDWVILNIDANAMIDFKSAFCKTNAANDTMSCIPLSEQQGEEAFIKLFEEIPNWYTRKQLEIPDYYPTDPQAEILIFNVIPIEYIHSVIFKDRTTYLKYQDQLPSNVRYEINKELFYGRQDYRFWQKSI